MIALLEVAQGVGTGPAPVAHREQLARAPRVGARRARSAEPGPAPRSASERSERQTGPEGRPVPLLETLQRRNISHPIDPATVPPDVDLIYTDSRAEHEYRANVAAVVAEFGWVSRAGAMRACGKAAVEIHCTACAAPHFIPFRCGARTCPTCARAAADGLVCRMMAKVAVHDEAIKAEPWDGTEKYDALTYYRRGESVKAPVGWKERRWRMVTITRRPEDVADPYNPDFLRAQVKQSLRLYAAWWRATPWGRQVRDAGSRRKRARRDTSYIVGVEVAPGGMVHFHAAIYGEYVQQRALLAAWRHVLQTTGNAASEKDGGVRVERVRDAGDVEAALREVLKYATKGQTVDGIERMPTAYQAAAVELAFRNVRRNSIGGAIRRFATDADADAQDADLHDDHVSACEACGTVGEWRWERFRGRDYVLRNGGYGIVRYDALGGDLLDLWLPPPDQGHCD